MYRIARPQSQAARGPAAGSRTPTMRCPSLRRRPLRHRRLRLGASSMGRQHRSASLPPANKLLQLLLPERRHRVQPFLPLVALIRSSHRADLPAPSTPPLPLRRSTSSSLARRSAPRPLRLMATSSKPFTRGVRTAAAAVTCTRPPLQPPRCNNTV